MMNKDHIQLGIAPIGWTNDDLPELGRENTWQQCLSEMALAGYEGCEIGGQYPKDVEVLRKALDLRKLHICNSWFSTWFAEAPSKKTIDTYLPYLRFLQSLGAKVIGCSEQSGSTQGCTTAMYGERPQWDTQQWQKISQGYSELAKIAEDHGMKACLHHHMGTGIQTPVEIDRFLDATPDNVSLLFDSGHIFASEGTQQAVEEVLKKTLPRVAHIHLKDCRPHIIAEVKVDNRSFLQAVKAGIFTVPGDGIIDFRPLFTEIDRSGYRGWMVVEAEQDPALANPLEYAIKARNYLRQHTGL